MSADPHQLAQVLVDQAEAAGALEHVLHEIRRRCLHDWITFGVCDVGAVCRRCGLEVPREVADLGMSRLMGRSLAPFSVTRPAEPPDEG